MSVAYDMSLAVHKGLQTLHALKAIPASQRALENSLQRDLQRVFDRAAQAVLDELKDLGRTPQGTMETRRATRHIEQANDRMEDMIADAAVEAAQEGRQQIMRAEDVQLERFSGSSLSSVRDKAESTSGRALSRMMTDLHKRIEDAAAAGLSVEATSALLRTEFDNMADYELNRVVRTEINRAQQEAAQLTEIALGVEYHEWLSAEDERVRDTHDFQHEQIVRVGEYFSNRLERPGDQSGPIEEWINCRCRLAPFLMPEGMKAPSDRTWFYADDLVPV